MFRILGHPRQVCAGLTRRELLVAGGLAGVGLAGGTTAAARPARRAKSVICLFLFSGWSQQETFDLKPDAPAVRRPGRRNGQT